MIPKKMVMFWDGKPMSWMRYLSALNFRRLNPDWPLTICVLSQPASPRTWVSHEKDDAEYHGRDYFPDLASLDIQIVPWAPPKERLAGAHAADLFRWKYLADEGGFYADFDILWVRPLDKFYQLVKDSDAMLCRTPTHAAIGFLGGTPGCRLWYGVWRTAWREFNPESYQAAGVWALYHCAGTTSRGNRGQQCLKGLKKSFNGMKIADPPTVTVYPWDWDQVDQIFSRNNTIPDLCAGIHWFAGADLSHEWNLRLNEGNYKQYNNTFCNYVRHAT